MPPGQRYGEDRTAEEGPLDRPLDDEAAQQEEEEDEGSDIDGPRGEGLIAPVVIELPEDLLVLAGDMPHSIGILSQRTRGTAVGIGHEQRQRLALAVAPGRDVVLVEARGGGLLSLRPLPSKGRQFAASTDGLCTVLVGVVEVGAIDADGDQSRA